MLIYHLSILFYIYTFWLVWNNAAVSILVNIFWWNIYTFLLDLYLGWNFCVISNVDFRCCTFSTSLGIISFFNFYPFWWVHMWYPIVVLIFIFQSINGLPWWLTGYSIFLECRRPGFDPWVGNIPWRRKWQPTPVPLLGESHGQRSLMGYSPWGHRVGHDWATSLSLKMISNECENPL